MTPHTNPVLPGCHPDPSICRADDAYYLVTSSFGWFPGLPVHRSTDLVSWEPIGHVLDRPDQLPLTGLDLNDGIWAATIRHHDGIFYVVATLARERRGALSFVATATDPAGPWSDPVALDADGIDPSLFFDHDGRCWYTAARDSANPALTGPGELWLRELDIPTLTLTGPEHVLWHGALHGQWVEGPHLYRRDGRYWLIAAEGGTERNHAVTAASATDVTGPYTVDPRSPLLTHRHLDPGIPVQNVGHADLVDGPDGRSWAVLLGVRAVDGLHTLGRETFLVPVEWTSSGPVFAPGVGMIHAAEDSPGAAETLDPDRVLSTQGWMSMRGPVDYRVDGETLTLPPSPEPLTGTGTPALLARRQQHQHFRFTGRVSGDGGLVVLLHQQRWATFIRDGDCVRLSTYSGQTGVTVATVPVHGPTSDLLVTGDLSGYRFTVIDPTGPRHLGQIPRSFFATEIAGGFLGVHLGIACAGSSPAGFSGIEYRPLPLAAQLSTV